MEKISLRSVDFETRTYIKKQTVHLHLAGKKHDEIVEALNISYDAVSRIVRAFRKNGSLPKEKTKGRKKGEKRTLSAGQEKEIQRIIIDKYPDQMKTRLPELDTALNDMAADLDKGYAEAADIVEAVDKKGT